MNIIIVTSETLNLLQQHAEFPFIRDDIVALGDNDYQLKVDDEVMDVIIQESFEEESPNDFLLRTLTTKQ